MIHILLKSLAVTLVVEVPLAALLGLRNRDGLIAAALMNLVTNPPAVFAITLTRKLLPAFAAPVTALCETLAVLIEYALLRRCLSLSRKRAAGVAVLVNLASFLVGRLL